MQPTQPMCMHVKQNSKVQCKKKERTKNKQTQKGKYSSSKINFQKVKACTNSKQQIHVYYVRAQHK